MRLEPTFPVTHRQRGDLLKTLRAMVRNPLEALPPEIFHEPLVFLRQGRVARLYLADPGLIQDALVRNADALTKGQEIRRILGPALGRGLLTAEEPHWRWQRRSVSAAFQPSSLQGLLPAMITCAERTRDRWLASDDSILLIGHEMMRTTFDIIVETMLAGAASIDAARVERSVTDYLRPTGWMLAYSLLRTPEWLPHPGRGRALRAAAYMRAELTKMVEQRRSRPIERQDLVTTLLSTEDPETGRGMNDREVVDNLLTFVTAGHETTANGLAWTLHLLSRHPDVEARLVAEIEGVTAGGPVRPEHIDALAYTRQVFSEAMRLYPPAPLISRQVLTSFPLNGVAVPRDTVIVVPIYAVLVTGSSGRTLSVSTLSGSHLKPSKPARVMPICPSELVPASASVAALR